MIYKSTNEVQVLDSRNLGTAVLAQLHLL